MLQTFLKKIIEQKIIAGIIVVVLIAAGYVGLKTFRSGTNATSYVTAAVEKGTIIVSLSGSGQVSASDQVNIKPEVSGKVVSLNVANGEKVKAGSLLFTIDKTDYQKAVADAETALETAQLDLDDLLAPPDELTLLQSENALAKAKQSKKEAEENIKTGYEDMFYAVTDVFFDLPTIIIQARDVLYGYDIAKSETTISDYDWNKTVYQNSFAGYDKDALAPFIESAESDYKIARENYDQNLSDYKNSSYNADNAAIGSLLDETATTTKAIAQAIKSEINLLDFVTDYLTNHNLRIYSAITSYRSSLKSYYSQTNSFVQNLASTQRSLQSNSQALIDAEISLQEKELSLADLKAGADELEIRSKKNAVQQKEEALETAKQNLSFCSVQAPFDGLIAEVNIKKGDTVSAASAAVTLISQQNIAEITLNEIDVAKVKVGQKTNITFDAVEDLNITGEVADVDTLGTVSQGVVTYSIKITFDTQDEKVKPGMSLSTTIITDVKQDVLLVSNSAIKSSGNTSYVEIIDETTSSDKISASIADSASVNSKILPRQQTVETGISNDSVTEIVSGLKEGDKVVTQTITANTSQSQTQQSSSFRIPGVTSGGGFISR